MKMAMKACQNCPEEADGSDADDILSDLESVKRTIEDKFLSAGDILVKSLNGIKELLNSLQTLITIFDSTIVGDTTADLKLAASKLFALPATNNKRIENIDKLNICCEELVAAIDCINGNLAYMRAFIMNIKIVAASVEGYADDFGIFANEMAACIAKGTGHVTALRRGLTDLKKELFAATTQGKILSLQIETILPSVPNELTASCSMLEDRYTNISNISNIVFSLAKNIRQRVARILTALQIGDNTRQRIEHMQACFVQLRASEISNGFDAGMQAHCYALVAMHLTDIITNFNKEITEIEQCMSDMARDANELLSVHKAAFGVDSEAGDGFLHKLSRQIEDALGVVNNMELADLSAMETGRVTLQTAQGFCSEIERIDSFRSDVLYMAMNTTLKCCQIGNVGLPLGVIATEIQNQSKKLAFDASVCTTALDKLTHQTGTLTDCENTKKLNDSGGLAAAQALQVALRRIQQARDLSENNIADIAARGSVVYDMLMLSSEKVRFHGVIGDRLKHILGMTKKNSPEVDQPTPIAFLALLEEVASHYTMAAERDIHAEFSKFYKLESVVSAPAKEDEDFVLF